MSLSALLLWSAVAFADDAKSTPLIDNLPDDGVWTTLQVSVRGEGADVSLIWTIRSVGTVTHNGKVCRCLEMEQVCDKSPKQILVYMIDNVTWRLIVPEEAFGRGIDPIPQALKVWQQIGQNEPALVPSLAAGDPLLATLLQGPPGKLKREPAKEKVAWQRGTLDCQVLTGRQELDFAGARLQVATRILRHPEAPFSVAGARKELKASAGGADYEVTIDATLRDHGKEAKPKLPYLVP